MLKTIKSLFLLFLLLSTTPWIPSARGQYVATAFASGCLTFYPADVFVNMNGTTTGTAVTTSNLATGTEGASTSWNSASAAETFGASQIALPAGITVNGTVHGCGYATQSLDLDAGTANTKSNKNIPGSHNTITFSGWISNLPSDQGASGSLWNLVEVDQGVSPFHSAFIQLQNGNNQSCGAYGIAIEFSGPTAHSSCLAVSPGGTYYYSFKVDFSSNLLASLRMYTTSGTTFTQVGSEVTVALGSGTGSMSLVGYGNANPGTQTGLTIHFQNMMIDWTNNNYPNLPH